MKSTTSTSLDDASLEIYRKSGVEPSQFVVRKSICSQSRRASHQRSSERRGSGSADFGGSSAFASPTVAEMSNLAIGNLTVVGRDDEHQQLLELYKDKNTKMVTIVGPSGLGKSVVAQHLREAIVKQRRGSIVCSGKFDVQNRADPYQAFVEAIGSFVSQVLSNKERCGKLGTLLSQTIGEEMDILQELVPSIASLQITQAENNDGARSKGKDNENGTTTEGDNPGTNNNNKEKAADRSITERAARIQNVLVEFVKLASTEEYPLTMLLDDIQWAGSASLGLIEALLEDDQLEHFFLLTTCRDAYLQMEEKATASSATVTASSSTTTSSAGETENNPFSNAVARVSASIEKPYPELIDLLNRYSQQSVKLNLQPLSLDSVQELINILLRQHDADKNRKLAEIVQQKTAGNPFFILQFMNVLVDEGLLTFHVGSWEWSWMEGEILSQNVAANVAEAVYKRLKKIDPEDLFALQLVSAIGNTFELPMVQFVLDGLRDNTFLESEWTDTVWPTDLHWSFERLVDTGILEKQFWRGKYDFSHDQIQSVAFRLIPEDRRAALQLAIGKRLIEGLDAFQRDQFLFSAAELCIAGMELMDETEKRHLAFWVFLAGDAALKQGAFETALRYLSVSIEALGENPFQKDAELSIPLFCGALEAAFTLNIDEKVDSYLTTVLSQSQIPLVTKSRAALIQIKTFATRHKFNNAYTYMCQLFKELGAGKVSPKAGLLSAVFELKKTYKMLSKYNQKEYLDFPLCTDPKINMAVDMIKAGQSALYLGNPPLFIIFTCKGLQLSIKHGISPSTPMTMSCVGILFAGILKDYDRARELGESGLAICEKYRFKKVFPQTATQTFVFIRHYKRPMQHFVAPLRYSMDVGMRMGVMEDVSLAKGMFCHMVNATGTTALPQALPEMERYQRNIKYCGHNDQWLHAVTAVQFAQKLSRPHRDDTTLDGDCMVESKMFDLARSKGEMVTLGCLNNYKVQLLVHFGDPLDAIKHGEESAQMGIAYGMGTPFIPRFEFFVGIANLWAFEKTKMRKYLKTARMMKNRLKALAKVQNPNVLHFLLMLRAEMTRVLRRSQKEKMALDQLNEAAVTARRMGSTLDNAFANELRARFYLDSQCHSFDKEEAAYYMRAAIKSYTEYGAKTKVIHLLKKYNDLLLAHPLTEQEKVGPTTPFS